MRRLGAPPHTMASALADGQSFWDIDPAANIPSSFSPCKGQIAARGGAILAAECTALSLSPAARALLLPEGTTVAGIVDTRVSVGYCVLHNPTPPQPHPIPDNFNVADVGL